MCVGDFQPRRLGAPLDIKQDYQVGVREVLVPGRAAGLGRYRHQCTRSRSVSEPVIQVFSTIPPAGLFVVRLKLVVCSRINRRHVFH